MIHVCFLSVPIVRVEVSYMLRFLSSYGRETEWTSRAERNVMSRRKDSASPWVQHFLLLFNHMLDFCYEGGHCVIGSVENVEACCKEWSHMSVNVTSGSDVLAKRVTSCIPSGWSGRKEERSCGSPSAAAVTAPHIGRGRKLWWLHLLIRLFKGWISAQMRRAEKVGRVLLTLRVLEGCVLCDMLGLRNSSATVMKITDN